MTDDTRKLPELPEEQSLDDLIRSTREEIERADRMMGETPPQVETKREPAFQPELPREYASLTIQGEQEPEPNKRRSGKRAFIYVACVLLASMVLGFFAWRMVDDVCALTRSEEIVTVTVEEGDGVPEIADALHEAGLVRYPWLFRIYCSLSRSSRNIRPGAYDLNAIFDYHALVNAMSSSAARATVSVTIPEGYTCQEIFGALEEKGVCAAADLEHAAADGEFDYPFLEGAPVGGKGRLEGCLFPDTYEFYVGDNPENVLNKFLRNTNAKLTAELWEQLDELNADLRSRKAAAGFTTEQIAASELTMYDVLIVASLIEKETAGAAESGTIASVIYNRLCSKAYPYLNIDATIQYALGERKEVLTDSDKLIDSPYNTYDHPGLPVGPISCPGMASIRAALFPQDTDYYFYALGADGTHTFTRTYDEHLAFLATLSNG